MAGQSQTRARRGESKRDETRRHLIDTALRIIADKGMQATSVLEITQAANVSNGTFYYHFKDKTILLEAVGQMLVSDVVEALHDVIDDMDSPEEKVALGIQWMVEKAAARPELGLVMAEAIDEEGAFQAEVSTRFRRDVEEGIARKQFFVDPNPLLFQMLGRVNAVAIRERVLNPDAVDVGFFTAQMHLRMLGVDVHKATILSQEARDWLRDHWAPPQAQDS